MKKKKLKKLKDFNGLDMSPSECIICDDTLLINSCVCLRLHRRHQ